jgi:omega-6 fatty acid desaturase (delta-12 desaturase)
MRRGNWDAAAASMEASSWLHLPRMLRWITGNIGFHHVHHLNPRVPNYRLASAHDALQRIWPVKPLSLRRGLRAPWLALWDEASGRLVSFRDVTLCERP